MSTHSPFPEARLCRPSVTDLPRRTGSHHPAHANALNLSGAYQSRIDLLVLGSSARAHAQYRRTLRSTPCGRQTMTAIAPHVTAFFHERLTLERRVSLHTCDSYAYAFQLLLNYASQRLKVAPSRLELEQIDAPLVVSFLNHLETTRSNGASSRNVRLAAIKSFMHFMEYRAPSVLEQIRRILAIPMKKTDTHLVRHLSTEEVQALLDAPKPTDWAGIRDRAMLHLCFAAGLRVSELTSLRLEDLSLHPHASILVHGKGRRERCLPLWKQTAAALRPWLAVRGAVLAPELFVNARREPMTRSGFEYILEKYVHAASKRCPSITTKRISPHVLRHSCALTV